MVYKKHSLSSAFTIVELLVAIVVISILATIAITSLNPAELLAQARDSRRISDINTIKTSIGLSVIDKPDILLLGVPNTVYVSLPDTSTTCANITGLPTLPATPSWSYHCVTAANLQKNNGTGWLPINFSSLPSTSLSTLPIDPQNNAASGKYYTYVPNAAAWEITSFVESSKYRPISSSDGGRSADILEVGTQLGITPRVENYIGNGSFAGCQNVINEYGSNPDNTIITMENPGSSNCVLRQNGPTTEYEIHFKTGTQIEANTTYCMSLWVAYSAGYNGDNTILHSRWYDAASNSFTTGGSGTLFRTKIIDGLSWAQRYTTFTTPSTVNGGYNWYVGYPTANTIGYRYVTDISLTKATGTECPTIFINQQ